MRTSLCCAPWLTSREYAADHLGGVVDHGDDAGVVDAGRADDADGADDLLAAVAIGGDDHRAAGEAEQLVLGADEDLHALREVGGLQQPYHRLLGLERGEERADALEIGERRDLVEQMGLPADDEGAALLLAGPG